MIEQKSKENLYLKVPSHKLVQICSFVFVFTQNKQQIYFTEKMRENFKLEKKLGKS
jgi:hypothetical protein